MTTTVLSLAGGTGMGERISKYLASCENRIPARQAPALRTPGSRMGLLTQSVLCTFPFNASL